MTDAEIIARMKALPAVPVVLAKDMMYAQGWKPSAEERAALVARNDCFEELGMPRGVNILVLDCYTKAKIGSLHFTA